ncbi:transketolase [Neobacillus cucumis]|uniref:transketolase n=1 Tax=Neobacillus cucumis TaxID=1740721 RepID=UPI0028536AD5|nr:transketolase [Neobacillus cucumis]MDR4945061.1 transketolase [Neobacillus cucumis]
MPSLDNQVVQSLRVLSIDMIEKSKSGHPGLPMGAAPAVTALWKNHLKFNPTNPEWFNRDRFILSAGHGSALLYSLLHVFGYDLPMSELQQFRQMGSLTPGHPEYKHTVGVDATTGPLGQGIAMGVGMAMTEAHLAALYNRPNYPIVDHYTYLLCGDGCLMEGISYEAASLAGHLQLGKLILLYDSNNISLDGDLDKAFSEDIEARFRSCGWQTIIVEDGNDLEALNKAIAEAKLEKNKPTLIEVKTVIGYGSPNKAGSSAVHGSPLGAAEAELTKQNYDWDLPPFTLPEEVEKLKQVYRKQGTQLENGWFETLQHYYKEYPELQEEVEAVVSGSLAANWDDALELYNEDHKAVATRDASGTALNQISVNLPTLFGGSADLASSNKTMLKNAGDFTASNYAGKNIWFGVREFAMGGILNGMALHGGVHPFGATFFVFSDYLRSAVRSAALMGIPATYVMTHDSIAVGEDGPTHEPVEQLASFRAMPGLNVIRPADANETAEAYRYALSQKENPVMLVLSRQNLPILPGSQEKAREGVLRGGYVLVESEGKRADVILIGTGSEVSLLVEARKELAQMQIDASVVSMPSWDLFEQQSKAYRDSVLPWSNPRRLACEMGSTFGWQKYVGCEGKIIGIDTFGASAPGEELMRHFGFTVENIVNQAKTIVANARERLVCN